jgi:hypothetical protein
MLAAVTWAMSATCAPPSHRKSKVLQFYPHFSLFLTHVTLRALSFPHHLLMCTQHVPPSHRTYSHLHCTHVHYPICLCPCLVPYGCAAASYYVPLTHSSLTHSSPFVLYTFPIWYASWSPSTSQIHHCFTFIRSPMLLSLIQYYT